MCLIFLFLFLKLDSLLGVKIFDFEIVLNSSVMDKLPNRAVSVYFKIQLTANQVRINN